MGRRVALPAAHCTCPQVEDLNAKWQRYDASRDEYVRELRAHLRGLQAPQPEAELMRKEIARLNRQLEERISECAGAARELAAARERAQMLEQQVGGAGQASPSQCSLVMAEGLLSSGPRLQGRLHVGEGGSGAGTEQDPGAGGRGGGPAPGTQTGGCEGRPVSAQASLSFP